MSPQNAYMINHIVQVGIPWVIGACVVLLVVLVARNRMKRSA